MPGSTRPSQSTREAVEESLANLRRNIGESTNLKDIRRYRKAVDQLLNRYRHLGVR